MREAIEKKHDSSAAATQPPPFDAIVLRQGTEEFVHLCWMLHNQCNHRCSYCSEVNWSGSFRWLQLNDATRFVERVLAHYPNRKVLVSFTGGEPTLWPDFGPFVEWLSGKGITVGMTTNGTRNPGFFARYARHFAWVSFSYHPEFTRAERFLENVAESSKHTCTAVRLMMPSSSELWEKSQQFLGRLESWNAERRFTSSVKCELVPVVKDFGTAFTRPTEYSAEQNQELSSPVHHLEARVEFDARERNLLNHLEAARLASPGTTRPFEAAELISRNQTNFRGWTCDIGLEQLFIDEQGNVLRAGCRVGGILGHISDEGLVLPTRAVRCIKSYCHCVTDVLTSKRSPQWQRSHGVRQDSYSAQVGHWLRAQIFGIRATLHLWDSEEYEGEIRGAAVRGIQQLVGLLRLGRKLGWAIYHWWSETLGELAAVAGAVHAGLVRTLHRIGAVFIALYWLGVRVSGACRILALRAHGVIRAHGVRGYWAGIRAKIRVQNQYLRAVAGLRAFGSTVYWAAFSRFRLIGGIVRAYGVRGYWFLIRAKNGELKYFPNLYTVYYSGVLKPYYFVKYVVRRYLLGRRNHV